MEHTLPQFFSGVLGLFKERGMIRFLHIVNSLYTPEKGMICNTNFLTQNFFNTKFLAFFQHEIFEFFNKKPFFF